MSENMNLPTIDFAAAFAAIDARYRQRMRVRDEQRPIVIAALCDALSVVGINSVVVTFDGYGDSGQIESVDAFSGDEMVELPTTPISYRQVGHDGVVGDPEDITPRDAIENLAYELLEATHPGWENNDGAYGEFTLDVAAGTITLDHNERFTDVTSYSHEW